MSTSEPPKPSAAPKLQGSKIEGAKLEGAKLAPKPKAQAPHREDVPPASQPKPAPANPPANPSVNPPAKAKVKTPVKTKTSEPLPPAKIKPKPPPAKAKPKPSPPPADVRPPAPPSRLRSRHYVSLLSFLVMVVVPSLLTAGYLWVRAADQYASYMGFSVRTEETTPSIASLLGPLNVGAANTPDADILYEFIQSQDLVARIDDNLDLRGIWSKIPPGEDPVFSYRAPGTIEDLLSHWKRKVRVVYDSGSGLIEVRVLAFTAQDAQNVADEILRASTDLVNNLSATARTDGVAYARIELEKSVERLKAARRAVTEFRNRTQIVDPTIDVQGQAIILNSLQQQLAEALIELDLLAETTRVGDPRIIQANRRIKVIEGRITDEKRKLGIAEGDSSSEAYANLVGEFESLIVDREFAEQTYTAALAAFDGAQAEAVRQTRYLAAHVQPTRAEKSEYPKRWRLLGLVSLFSFLIWSVVVLVGYSLRDRR